MQIHYEDKIIIQQQPSRESTVGLYVFEEMVSSACLQFL